jgi:alkylation response protein AidB-like acyl-CoA dehydrogenase
MSARRLDTVTKTVLRYGAAYLWSYPDGVNLAVIDRMLPSPEAADLLALTRELAAAELAPQAAAAEESATFPRAAFRLLGRSGLLSLPYPEAFGGGDQPYEVYLQVLEELGRAWMSVAVGTSVHSLSCFPLAQFGTPSQQAELLPGLLAGDRLGAYCLSEPQAGSDVSAISTKASRAGDGWRLSGTKAWITHGGVADFYSIFARTGDDPTRGLSCFLVDADAEGLSFGAPERKMGLTASPTTLVHLDDVLVPADRLVGEPGSGMRMALSALDSGRLGIAAAATGLAQSALDVALDYAKQRVQFGRPITDFQGVSFLLADMEAAIESARATYLSAARLRDAGRPFGRAAACAKLIATDAAMRVTTDAVQVLGGAGYTRDFPVERFMREAKVTQIFEGTNQVQRLVIARSLLR